MKYNKLSHYILSLLLSSALLGGCNKHPMAAMSEEENSWQESVGLITILEAEPLEAMDSARVPATIDVAQEASAHGSSASRSFEVGDSMEPSELSSIVRKTGLKEEAASVKSVETARCYRNALAAVVIANTARDAAVTWANEEVARANTERDAAVAREKTAREELAARDQEIAQTSNALAVAPRPRTFGEAEWKQHFGDVGSAPPLPSDIAAILDGPCPFWPNKKVRDTHLLVLIPATVGGVPFTLNQLGELVKHPSHGGHKTKYSYYHDRVKAQMGAASPPRSYWVLMTRDVLPGSRNTGYADQKALVAGYASRESVPYALPSVLEAATAILMHHVREGERLFGDRPLTFTRCQEVVDGRYPIVVGGFSSWGLFVCSSHDVSACGVSCLRGSQWQAVVPGQDRPYTPQRTLSVVSSCDVGTQLAGLQRQDVWASRSRIHIMTTSSPPYAPCVYLGKCGLLGGMPSDEEEDSKPPARRKSPSPDDELAKCNKKACHGERREQECIRRDTLNILLDMAGSEPDKASEFLEVLLAAVKDKHCRQKALRALGKVAQAAPDRISECLPSLRAAARNGDREVCLSALRTLGEVEWKHYFGDVGSAPPLPSDMAAILDGPCPFWKDQLVKDTHLLVLIPATVGGVPLTLNQLGELIKHPSHGGHKTKYSYYHERVKAQIGAASPPRSYWVLMTRDALPDSRTKTYEAQKVMVAAHAGRVGLPYELPHALEAATTILMHHVREGERLFGDRPLTFTRCQEVVHGYPIVVGGFSSGGLDVDDYDVHDYRSSIGVSCLRKF